MGIATILDVLHAVKRVAAGHGEVEAWWYAPPRRLHVAGELAETDETLAPELAIDVAAGAHVDEEVLARELRDLMGVSIVRVHRHRGDAEPRKLFRLVTTRRES